MPCVSLQSWVGVWISQKRGGGVLLTPCFNKDPDHGCVRDRLGSSFGPSTDTRGLVPRQQGSRYECPGAQSHHTTCVAFLPVIWNLIVQNVTANMTAMHCICKQGSPDSLPLCMEAIKFWYDQNGITLMALHQESATIWQIS